MSPTGSTSPILPPQQHSPVEHTPLPTHSAAGNTPGAARSPSLPPAHSPSRQQALLRQLPSGADKLAPLASILKVNLQQLDELLPAVAWTKENGMYALRSVENGRGYTLHFDDVGEFTDFPANTLEDTKDNSEEAKAARQVHKLMTEVAAPYVRARLLDAVRPVEIGGEQFHLQVSSMGNLRAYTVLDDGQKLPLVKQDDHYVPQADLSGRPASPSLVPLPSPAAQPTVLLSSTDVPGSASAAFRPTESGVDDALSMPLFGLDSEEAAFIKPEPGSNVDADARQDKGKRVASSSPPREENRAKRPRHEGPLPYDAGTQVRWDAFRDSQEAELPDISDLDPAARVLLQAASISVPCRMEYEHRDWQARGEGKPVSGQAIIQAHRQACFNRIAARVSGVTSYSEVKLGSTAKEVLNTLPLVQKTAAYLYGQLELGESKQKQLKKGYLRHFDAFLAQPGELSVLSLDAILENFETFAKYFHAYEQTLSRDKAGDYQRQSVKDLLKLCYPQLPFYKDVVDRIEEKGTKFYDQSAKTKADYRGVALYLDSFLARNGYGFASIPDDVEGLRPFLAIKKDACAEENNSKLTACANLWRQDAHRLYLDDMFDAAIAASTNGAKTKKLWTKYAPRLADYAWHRQMPKAEYASWLLSVDLKGPEFKTACESIGLRTQEVGPMISYFRQHRAASGSA